MEFADNGFFLNTIINIPSREGIKHKGKLDRKHDASIVAAAVNKNTRFRMKQH